LKPKNQELALRPKVLEGELVDVDLEAALENYGLQGGIQMLLYRRYVKMIEREFLTAGLPPGVDGPVIEIEPA
jgi:hypothetical protein